MELSLHRAESIVVNRPYRPGYVIRKNRALCSKIKEIFALHHLYLHVLTTTHNQLFTSPPPRSLLSAPYIQKVGLKLLRECVW